LKGRGLWQTRRALVVLILSVTWFINPAFAAEPAEKDITLSSLAQSLNAMLEYDPLTRSGTLEKTEKPLASHSTLPMCCSTGLR
jgi:hypothetical protein